MKVRELITKLQTMPQDHEVILDLHSEYNYAKEPQLFLGYDNRGYVSRPYANDKETYRQLMLKCHGFVYIPVQDKGF